MESAMKNRLFAAVVATLFAVSTLAFAGGGTGTTKTGAKSEKASCCSTKASAVKKVSADKCAVDAKSTKECSTEKAQSCSMSSAKKSGSCCSMKAGDVKTTSAETTSEVGSVANTEQSPK
jgi:hypothetical protein